MSLGRVVLACLGVAMLAFAGCASGSAIVTGTPRPLVAVDQVKIYLEPPSEYEVIGIVNASSDAGWTEQGSMNYAIEELKKQAAKLGANGVLLVSTGEKTTGIISGDTYAVPVTAKTAQAQAIFVQKE
jgi:hypothetical protein